MDDTWVLITEDGELRGRAAETPIGFPYLSFLGIPYAQPPIGPLRFQPPQQVQKWTGVKDASIEGPNCPGFNLNDGTYDETSNEDCLYLNVYCPRISEVKYPVLFWIHGGGFYGGNGGSVLFGPEFLLPKNIIIVSINYRLGVLGFLSLQNDKCPGNNGLKDQIMALKWVQRNISHFGGDPNNVTIFGESAGAGSVGHLMVSPQSPGLFHRAIGQSGHCLCPRLLARKPKESAFMLGQILGLATEDPDELLEFLRNFEIRELVEQGMRVRHLVEPEGKFMGYSFVPCVEPDLPGAVLPMDPTTAVQQGLILDVPYLMGLNVLDASIVYLKDDPLPETVEDIEKMIPTSWNIPPGSDRSIKIANGIKDFYFKDGVTKLQFIHALSWMYFNQGNIDIMNSITTIPNRNSPVHVYYFTYEGIIGVLLKSQLGFGDCKGTIHGQDVIYYWRAQAIAGTAYLGQEKVVVERFTDMITNFAHGNVDWDPYNPDTLPYLTMGWDLTHDVDFEKEKVLFWKDILSTSE